MEFISQSYDTIFGSIDYCYFPKLDDYPNGLLVFMGSYIEKKYRGEGHYKEMVRALLSNFPENTIVHIPIENKHIMNMFLRMNFKIVDKIEFWGKPANCKVMAGILNSDNINNL
jgi:hypothetical protein